MAAHIDPSLVSKAVFGALGFMWFDAKNNFLIDQSKGHALARATLNLKLNNWRDRNSIWYFFEYQAAKQPNELCYICEDVQFTWKETETLAIRFGHWLLSKGLKRKDKIALMMPNKPLYPIAWLGSLYVDIIPAFINYNLTDKGLLHCVKISSGRHVLFDATLEKSIADISDGLKEAGITPVRWTDDFSLRDQPDWKPIVDGAEDLSYKILDQQSSKPLGHEYRDNLKWADTAVLVYTSGTTGLPKAATCAHGRIGMALQMWPLINGFTKKDRIYTPMPLYHSTASFLAVAASWYAGSTIIIGRKFSATRFWDEVRRHDATVIQYVGEVCRYLLATPPNPELDKKHNVRIAYGNGMRPDVWSKFRDRFGVRTIGEFFASTEGNGSLFNFNTGDFGAGAVGQEGTFASIVRKKDQAIIKLDAITEEPYRDAKGFCIRTDVNEPGELLLSIDNTSAHKAFTGYQGNDEATKKKILNDVFTKGDTWFRTGDLLKKDADGHIFFGDRLGDTFRFKGENVSTAEVAAAMGDIVEEANVYGVLVPGHEGRAGCAAIPTGQPVDYNKLAKHLNKSLPKYAVPIFLRLVPQLEQTGTSKQVKVALRNEGIDLTKVKDPVYWLKGGTYVPFTPDDHASIVAGKVRL